MNKTSNKKGKQGLILIELLIAMAIFAIGTVTVFTLFVGATQGVIIGLEKTRGFLLSTEALEAAFSISRRDQDYLTPGKYEVGVNNGNQWVLIPKTGLMGHFLLANNAQDSSIYKNHGIIQQVSFFEDRKGQSLAAARFNRNDSYIKTEYAFSLQIEGPLTLSAWVLDTSVEKNRRTIAGKYDVSGEEGGYMLYKEGKNYYFTISGFTISGQGSTASVSAPSGSSWEHVVGVYDPGDQTIRLYINGQPMDPGATNVTSIKNIPEIEFFIGNDASEKNPWHGLISDVRVYKRSLTANEISGLYGSYSAPYEKSLIVSDLDELAGIWSFNEGEGCTAHDNSGNNNHGLIKNCPLNQEQWLEWPENRYGKQGRAFYFENENYIEIADSPTLQIKDRISISLWLKTPEDLPETDMTILHKRAVGSEDFSFALTYYDDDKFYGWAASVGPSEFNEIRLEGAAIANRWQHIIVTFDGNNYQMYLDNKKIPDLQPTTINNPGTESHLFIGRNAAGQANLSGIAIDDLRIYNKILTPTERQAIFLGKINYYLE